MTITTSLIVAEWTERHPGRGGADLVQLIDAVEQSWLSTVEDAFYAGFDASGEGRNGEYPFGDKGIDPRTDAGLGEQFTAFMTTKARP